MMTFYLGKEYNLYQKKFNELKEYFMKRAGSGTNAAIFRFIIDVLHADLKKREKTKEEDLELARQSIADFKEKEA